jgi:hypothetical protein
MKNIGQSIADHEIFGNCLAIYDIVAGIMATNEIRDNRPATKVVRGYLPFHALNPFAIRMSPTGKMTNFPIAPIEWRIIDEFSTGGLSAPIGGATPTKPNTQSGSTQSILNGAAAILTSTWNAGTVTGMVGEIGIYGRSNASNNLVGFGSKFYGAGGSFFASRLSVADDDFTAFTINTAAPLTINWTIQFTFQ